MHREIFDNINSRDNGGICQEKSTNLCSSHLEQIVFFIEEYDILRERKVDVTTFDHFYPRGQTRSRKMQDHHLI